MDASADLSAPVLLMAMPQVQDPFFRRSVVLLVHHDDEGSLGFIVNRPTNLRVRDILSGMEITWKGDDLKVAHFGGPVQPQLGSVLYSQEEGAAGPDGESVTNVMPGLGLTQRVDDLEVLATSPPSSFRLLLGYAGWESGQLVSEILRNDWLTAPVTRELLFEVDRAEAWEKALISVKVDPSTLPVWTPDGEDLAN